MARVKKCVACGKICIAIIEVPGNRRYEAARGNLEAEGAQGHCELKTGDMRALPFANNSFDLVVSSLAIHNIKRRQNRNRAVDEVAPVTDKRLGGFDKNLYLTTQVALSMANPRQQKKGRNRIVIFLLFTTQPYDFADFLPRLSKIECCN